jgi:hypothetical protein
VIDLLWLDRRFASRVAAKLDSSNPGTLVAERPTVNGR